MYTSSVTLSKVKLGLVTSTTCFVSSDLGVDTKPRIEQIKVEEPPKRKAGIKVASVEELVQKLKNEAKVI